MAPMLDAVLRDLWVHRGGKKGDNDVGGSNSFAEGGLVRDV